MATQQSRFPFKRRKRQKKQLANYAFIDSQNLNLGVQRVGWKMDWKKFRQYLKDEYNVEKAYMFIGYIPDNEDLYRQMQDAGYLVVLKPTVDMFMTKEEIADEKHVTKGNADAELVLHAMKELTNYDKAIIVSGDGDFFCLVEYLDSIGKLHCLLAPNDHYSTLYATYKQKILVLDTLKQKLAYDYIKRSKKRYRKRTQSKKTS